jgi:hypothetical protein
LRRKLKMTYNVGDILVGKGAFEGKRKYIVTKVTPKTVDFNLIQNGKVLMNCIYKAQIDEEGKLRINITPYRSIHLQKA